MLPGPDYSECFKSAPPSSLGLFELDVDGMAFETPAVQAGYRGAGLVAFHFNKTEALAVAGKDVPGELQ